MFVSVPYRLSEMTILVMVMLPQLVTPPLTVLGWPIWTVSHFFVPVRQGFTQIAHTLMAVLLTEPIAVMSASVVSVPRAVMLFVAAPVQVSPRVGSKLPWNLIVWPGVREKGWLSAEPFVSKSPAPTSGRLSVKVTLVNSVVPQLVTEPVKSIFASGGKQVGLLDGYAQSLTTWIQGAATFKG